MDTVYELRVEIDGDDVVLLVGDFPPRRMSPRAARVVAATWRLGGRREDVADALEAAAATVEAGGLL
jgi:hypothetical protein